MLILSKQNESIKALARLKNRAKRLEKGLFTVEGEHLCEEAFKEGFLTRLVVDKKKLEKYNKLVSSFSDEDIIITSEEILQKLCSTKTPQGIVGVCKIPSFENMPMRRLVGLNAVQDPGNVGSILRTMDAADFDCLIIDEKCADPFSEKAVRASMGAIFRVPVLAKKDLKDFIKELHGYDILAASLDGENFYKTSFNIDKFLILIGNEGQGLSEEIKGLANKKILLPMKGGAESLNAACAMSIISYDVLRREEEQ